MAKILTSNTSSMPLPFFENWQYETLYKVRTRVDENLQTDSNFSKGASGSEFPILYGLENMIDQLDLTEVLEVKGNSPKYRKYVRARGCGFDIGLYLKKHSRTGIMKVPLELFEVKNWSNDKWITPKQAQDRVIDRFPKTTHAQKTLIQYNRTPLHMKNTVKRKLKLHQISNIHLPDVKQLFLFAFKNIIKHLTENNLKHKLKPTISNNNNVNITCANNIVYAVSHLDRDRIQDCKKCRGGYSFG
ncbi:MAG: hypothetical protein PVH73_01600 [Candidatus Bathyarchaeota archaeon]